jgi:hypothetical protein
MNIASIIIKKKKNYDMKKYEKVYLCKKIFICFSIEKIILYTNTKFNFIDILKRHITRNSVHVLPKSNYG